MEKKAPDALEVAAQKNQEAQAPEEEKGSKDSIVETLLKIFSSKT